MNDFNKFMNAPEYHFERGKIVQNGINERWIVCPYCGKKNLLIQSSTRIHDLVIKCKGSNCKQEFEVEVSLIPTGKPVGLHDNPE